MGSAAGAQAIPGGGAEPESASASSGHELADIALEHAMRGLRLQTLLRALLVAFVTATVIAVPPVHQAGACYLLVGLYAAWVVGFTAWTARRGSAAIRTVWLAEFVDLAVLASLTLLAGVAAEQSWTADVLKNGFLFLPVLAATQLRPGVCAAVVGPTVLVYLAAAVATQQANAEPWASVTLGTFVLAGVGAGCIGLSAIQRSRVMTISRLVRERTHLLHQLITLERRERQVLAEQLHDGALQYVLAARQDLEDIDAEGGDALPRVRQALDESSRLLRDTLAELHPAVLERVGLAAALGDLARRAAAGGRRTVRLDLDRWPRQPTSADALLFSAAREVLSNVVKHAKATSVDVALALADPLAQLVIADDGCGTPPDAVRRGLADGHIGLASHALRVEAAGGSLKLGPGTPSGTVVTVELPCVPVRTGPTRSGPPGTADAGVR